MTLPYTGSGPYCYANSLAMVLGEHAPPTGVIECLTGSPFGFELLAGTLPFFDPYGWDPELGLDAAIGSLGWTCERTDGGSPEEAMARLRKACADGPVLTGPLEMGLLTHQPGMNAAIGADHYVVVLAVEAARSSSTTRTAIRTRRCPPMPSPRPGAATRSRTSAPPT
ncbi:MAG: hypothetical protein QOF44_731 [Streptomyces sp.]|nr:hypothetical protein [Streptomyces sp.]